jgi:hypothetical protein
VTRLGRLAFVAAAAALLALMARLPPTGFFSADSGPKYWQCVALADGSGLPRGFDYPAADLDPERRHIPPFTAPVGDRLASIYPIVFPIAAAGLYTAGGDRAMRLLPWLAALAAAWLTGRLAGALAGGPTRWTVAVLALTATPLAFYSIAFWEHSLATAMVLTGLLLVLPGHERGSDEAWRWAAVGVLLGAAGWVRTETVFLAPALAAAAFVAGSSKGRRAAAALAAGCAAGLAAGAMVQRVLLGSWLPLHVTYHVESSFATQPFVASRLQALVHFAAPDAVSGTAAVVWLAALAVVLTPAGARSRVGLGFSLAAMAAAAVAAGPAPAIRWLGGASPTDAFPVSAPAATWILISALPLLLWSQPRGQRLDRTRLTVLALAGWSVAAVLLARPVRSLEWGGRLFLTAVLLLLAVMGSLQLADGPLRALRRWALVVCIGAALVVQALGLVLLTHSSTTHSEIVREVAEFTSEGEPILTDEYMIPLLAGRGWVHRRYLYVTGEGGVARLAAACARAGIERWSFATLAGRGAFYPVISDRGVPVVGEDGSRWVVADRLDLAIGSERLQMLRYRRVWGGRDS